MSTSQYGYELCFFCESCINGADGKAIYDKKDAIHFITFEVDGENAAIKQPICDRCYSKRVPK